MDDRKALTGILFVLKSGIPWAMLPKEMGCGSGMTCWRRLRDWQAAGVWARLHRALLNRLGRANAIDFGRCSLDSASFAGKKGASAPASTRPTAASREPSATSWSTPAASRLRSCSAPANVHDSRLCEPLIDAVPPIRHCAGRPRKRPAKLHGDKGYDYRRCRRACRKRRVVPRIARRGVESGERLGRHRWVVERSLAWFARFRRLTVRYERRLDVLKAFHLLAMGLICFGFVRRWLG